MALPGTLDDYLKQKAAGTTQAGASFAPVDPSRLPIAPRLPAPSFSVSTKPPVMPPIGTWDDLKLLPCR